MFILLLYVFLLDGVLYCRGLDTTNDGKDFYDHLFDVENATAQSNNKILGYSICLIDQDCEQNSEKCISTICMKLCTTICLAHEYCNTTNQVCIPKIIRRRYTNACDEESHCLLTEACVDGKCVNSNNLHFDCHVDSECNNDQLCMLGVCQDSHKECRGERECAAKTTGWCLNKRFCAPNQQCVHNQCRNLEELLLNKVCDQNKHCFSNEKCVKQKCMISEGRVKTTAKKPLIKIIKQTTKKPSTTKKPNTTISKEVLPASFICDCDPLTEPCDIKDCNIEQKLIPKNQSFSIGDLKNIIRDLIREEENNLILEITRNKETSKEKVSFFNKLAKPRSKKTKYRKKKIDIFSKLKNLKANDIQSKDEIALAQLDKDAKKKILDVEEILGENCLFNDDCKTVNCCVMGVCMQNSNCSVDEDIKRDTVEIYELEDTDINCILDKDCHSGELCDFGFCKQKTVLMSHGKSDLTSHECSGDIECEVENHSCFVGLCVPSISMNLSSQLCHTGSTCENEAHTCWLNVCVT